MVSCAACGTHRTFTQQLPPSFCHMLPERHFRGRPGCVTADTGYKGGKPPCRQRDRHQGRREEQVCREGYHLLWPPPTCQCNGRTKLLLCVTARCLGESVHSRCSAQPWISPIRKPRPQPGTVGPRTWAPNPQSRMFQSKHQADSGVFVLRSPQKVGALG